MHHEDIKAAMRKRGVTPAELARHLQVSAAAVSKVMRDGSASRAIAEAIAAVCGVGVFDLWPELQPGPATSARVAQLLGTASRQAAKARPNRAKARA